VILFAALTGFINPATKYIFFSLALTLTIPQTGQPSIEAIPG
jgi:hypothetical protein